MKVRYIGRYAGVNVPGYGWVEQGGTLEVPTSEGNQMLKQKENWERASKLKGSDADEASDEVTDDEAPVTENDTDDAPAAEEGAE